MTSLNILYKTLEQLKSSINDSNIQNNSECFVRINASCNNTNLCNEIAKNIKNMLPKAVISGQSVSGIVYNGKIFEDEILITFTQLENSQIKTKMIELNEKESSEVVKELSLFEDEDKKAIAFLFFSSFYLHIGDVVKMLAQKYPNVTFVGGNVANIDKNNKTTNFIFNDEKMLESGVIVTYVCTDRVLTYANTVIGHEPIGKTYEITNAQNEYIVEIENKPASQWYYEKLNINNDIATSKDIADEYTSNLLSYPIVLDDNDGASRFVRSSKTSGKLKLFNSNAENGQKFRIGYLSPLKSAEEWQNVYHDVQNIPVEDVYCYSCIMRKNILNNLSKWEMNNFTKANICGAFLHGEIGQRNSHSNFFEGSCSFFTIADKQSYIKLDYETFNNVANLQEVSDTIIKQLNEENTLNSSEKSDKTHLVGEIIKSDTEIKSKMLADDYLHLPNMVKYFENQTKNRCKKLCLINVAVNKSKQNKSNIEQLKIITKKVLNLTKSIAEKHKLSMDNKLYKYEFSTFFFTGDNSVKEALFVDTTQEIYKELSEFMQSENENENYDINIVVTLSGAYITQLYDEAITNSLGEESVSFSVYNDDEDANTLKQEFKTVAAINYAIKHNNVIPYFQGIYDNRKNRFYCYEALMRMQDKDGSILLPKDFIEISKKYNLYAQLSISMVLKILTIFENRKEIISINISAIDVESQEFCSKLFEKLDAMESTNHFIFEIVETEKFENYDVLKEFIHKVRSYGVKIAIDDFGSGYSNFIEIGNLHIDFIKIDGTLITLLGTDSRYEQILQSIQLLSTKLDVQLIAEYVETATTQKNVVKNGVRFSQGYFFSKPMSIEELDIVSRDNPIETQDDKNTQDEEIRKVLRESKGAKNKSRLVFIGGAVVTLLVAIAIVLFATFNRKVVQDINDAFLVEIATNMSDKVSSVMEDSSILLVAIKELTTSDSYEKDEILQELKMIDGSTNFDEIYLHYNGDAIIDCRGNELNINVQDVDLSTNDGEVIILPPMTDDITNEEFFLTATTIYENNIKIGNLYGKYNLNEFSELLDIKNFGGEAFFHLCEVDGQPLILSGNSDNLFKGGDMYTFIGSLDIKNGHTAQSLEQDMQKGGTSLLKYEVSGEERSAVMVSVPNTPWVIVSIVQNEVTVGMIKSIQDATVVFTYVLVFIFIVYFTSMNFITKNIQKDLIKALENSKLLTNSLQTSIETDTLTRTYSRATITEKITDEINKAKQFNLVHAMLILDVDNFKAINDTYGHQTGDVYLQELVSAVKSSLRAGDIIGRLGGDEFAVMLCNVNSKENANNALERIFDKVKNISIEGASLDNVGLSAGVVMVPEQGNTYEVLSAKADKALYKAKNAGKNRWEIHEE